MIKILPLSFLVMLFTTCTLPGIILEQDTLSEAEAAQGLKDALSNGIVLGAQKAGQTDGYFLHPVIKIPFPPDAIKVANTLRDLGFGGEVDKVVLTVNRAAEDAALLSKDIFIQAIRELTIADAMNILFGPDTAATDYLRRTASVRLHDAFKPVIHNSLGKVNATKYWEDVITRYNKIPLVNDVNPDLEEFVTVKALDGLFFMVAEEEKKIRLDPIARTTEILKKVFGYYDRHK